MFLMKMLSWNSYFKIQMASSGSLMSSKKYCDGNNGHWCQRCTWAQEHIHWPKQNLSNQDLVQNAWESRKVLFELSMNISVKSRLHDPNVVKWNVKHTNLGKNHG